MMVILGLTGSIGMGKSTAAGMFRGMGIRVYDSDAAVHEAFARGGAAVAPVGAAFPGVVVDGAIDRGRLGARVFGDDAALARLEGIVHPVVRAVQDRFLRRAARDGARLVVLDVPLMFEVGLDVRCDAVVVVSAPAFVQRARVLARPGMTEEKLAAILARQMPDAEKRRRADFVVPTNQGKGETLSRLRRIVRLMKQRRGERWPPCPYREHRPGRGSGHPTTAEG